MEAQKKGRLTSTCYKYLNCNILQAILSAEDGTDVSEVPLAMQIVEIL